MLRTPALGERVHDGRPVLLAPLVRALLRELRGPPTTPGGPRIALGNRSATLGVDRPPYRPPRAPHSESGALGTSVPVSMMGCALGAVLTVLLDAADGWLAGEGGVRSLAVVEA